ncbi:hypothetical protein [Stenotrophomonas sp.]|uniref:hypothetical protein n=1 Tax=Stenotrophomonas sp. TaxID=69392 RepID=UPI00289DD933|nr:hypothetical protein [Stenotrophomonas sp.]
MSVSATPAAEVSAPLQQRPRSNSNRRLRTCLLLLVVIGPASTATATEFRDLKVLADVAPGLWSHSTSVTPATAIAPPTSEQGCVNNSQLQAMIAESLASRAKQCPMTFSTDTANAARGVTHCPKMPIPQLGIVVEAMDAPIVITHASEGLWTVTVDVPSTPGGTPGGVWRHEYRRLGNCPG